MPNFTASRALLQSSLVSLKLSTLISILSIGVLVFTWLAIYFHSTLEKYNKAPGHSSFGALVAVDNLLRKSSSFYLRGAVLTDLQWAREEPTRQTQATLTNSTEEGLSACLLVNDENARLPEWLAYHYYTLPLRSLIVAVDPASLLSPKPILDSFSSTLDGLDVTYWDSEDYYMPPEQRGGSCNPNDSNAACLWVHRERQKHFVMKCMEAFKRRGKSWVLLTDVDEYITFNYIHQEDDPPVPLDEAPAGIPTLKHWKIEHAVIDGRRRALLSGKLEQDGKNDTAVTTEPIKSPDADILYGNVVEDDKGSRYFLYDDSLEYQDPTKILSQAPIGIPTITDVQLDSTFHVGGRIYNDTYDGKPDGSLVGFALDPNFAHHVKAGHIIKGANVLQYYFIENDQLLWPPHVSGQQAVAARKGLPAANSGVTVRDVLESHRERLRFGSCLQMPRLLYGSKESIDIVKDTAHDTNDTSILTPTGFQDRDFVTMRYLWHGKKGNFETNKYQKTMIDVSHVPMDDLKDKKALNIHRPLKYFCRADLPRYSTSLFRVVSHFSSTITDACNKFHFYFY